MISVSRFMKSMIALFFPPKCIFCGRVMEKHLTSCFSECICKMCEAKHLYRCGDGCYESKFPTTQAVVSPLFYQDEFVANSIRLFKFWHRKANGAVYAKIVWDLIITNQGVHEMINSNHFMTAVPISDMRFEQRGYNQSDVIAEPLAAMLQLPYSKDILRKVIHTDAQSSFGTVIERIKNVENAFEVLSDLTGKSIVLVDDIYSTGATMNECAKTLLEAGAKSVIGVCAAINLSSSKCMRKRD